MKLKPLILATLLLAFINAPALAEANNGLGLSGALTNHSSKGQTIAVPAAVSWNGSGIGVNLDYQFAISPNMTLNPFFFNSFDSVQGTVAASTTAIHVALGLQLRYWMGDIFLGAHLGNYVEVLHNPNANTNANVNRGVGGGGGLVAGWEDPSGGMFVTGQYDSANLSFSDARTKLRVFRLSVGYRWK